MGAQAEDMGKTCCAPSLWVPQAASPPGPSGSTVPGTGYAVALLTVLLTLVLDVFLMCSEADPLGGVVEGGHLRDLPQRRRETHREGHGGRLMADVLSSSNVLGSARTALADPQAPHPAGSCGLYCLCMPLQGLAELPRGLCTENAER